VWICEQADAQVKWYSPAAYSYSRTEETKNVVVPIPMTRICGATMTLAFTESSTTPNPDRTWICPQGCGTVSIACTCSKESSASPSPGWILFDCGVDATRQSLLHSFDEQLYRAHWDIEHAKQQSHSVVNDDAKDESPMLTCTSCGYSVYGPLCLGQAAGNWKNKDIETQVHEPDWLKRNRMTIHIFTFLHHSRLFVFSFVEYTS
jgi:hypothetical protein